MNKKSTKRALLSSVLAIVICVTMLIGTTFAWFTDSVTSANNIIKSGNLDIELDYWNGEEWVTVEGSSDVLTGDLWEPGYTDIAYIRLSNVGSLAAKYQFGINIISEKSGVNKLGNSFLLSDYIYFDVLEGSADANGAPVEYATREDALKEVAGDKISAGFVDTGYFNTKGDLYFNLVAYMPETVGNEANHNGEDIPEINLGINVVATQNAHELDSFDKNYDKNAWTNGMMVYNENDLAAALANGDNAILANDITITETIVIPASASTSYSRRAVGATVNLNGKKIVANSSTYAFNNLGVVTFVDTVGTGSITARGMYNGYGNGSANVTTAKMTVVNGVYNAIGENGGAAIFNYGNVVIEDGTFTSLGSYSLNNQNTGVMLIEDATVTGGIYNVGELTINDGEIATNRGGYTHAIYHNGSKLVVNGGNFTGNGNEVINANSSEAIINGGTFTKVEKTSYLLAGSKMVIYGGNFNAHESNPAGHPVRPDVTVYGGTFNYKHTNIAAGNSIVKAADGKWMVISANSAEEVADGFYFDGEDTYFIVNAEGMKALAAEVNKYSNYEFPFANTTVLLMCDIDLGGMEWTPIGDYRFSANRFCGTFDGQGHTISNYKITKKTDKNDSNKSSYGLFGNMEGTLKNVTVDNASVSSYAYVGALIGRVNGGKVINCHVTNSSVASSYWQAGGMIGQLNGSSVVSGCTIKNSTITGKSALGGLIGPTEVPDAGQTLLVEDCSVIDCAVVQNGSFGGSYDNYFGGIFGYLEVGADAKADVNNCKVENTTIKGEKSVVLSGDFDGNICVDGFRCVSSAEELNAALKAGQSVSVAGEISNTTIELPSTLSDVTIKGGVFTNSTISAADGNSYSYKNLTFDGITFNNSRILLTGWRNGEEVISNLTVTNCVFKNLDDTSNTAPVHINKDASEAVNGFTFTNNVIDGATGGQKSGVYAQVTGKTVVTDNVINNVSFRPYVIQVTTTDGINDEFIVKGNTFSGSAVGRLQGLGSDSEGTDTVKLVVSGNIFKGITSVQQICYWNFNAATTTADLSKNYYDIDIVANPSKIYYNKAAASVQDLVEMGIYPYYTALNADGTINEGSLVTAQ